MGEKLEAVTFCHEVMVKQRLNQEKKKKIKAVTKHFKNKIKKGGQSFWRN